MFAPTDLAWQSNSAYFNFFSIQLSVKIGQSQTDTFYWHEYQVKKIDYFQIIFTYQVTFEFTIGYKFLTLCSGYVLLTFKL